MKLTVGIFVGHDSSVSVLKNGREYFSISEERLTRMKGYYGFPFLAVDYIFKNIIKKTDKIDITYCRFGHYIGGDFYQRLKTALKKNGKDFPKGIENINPNDCKNEIEYLQAVLKIYTNKKHHINVYEHHLSHASSAYYGSGFKDALVVTADGAGDNSSATIYTGKNGVLKNLYSAPVNNSIGFIYCAITAMLGFKITRHEGKITGLAAYGNGDAVCKEIKKIIGVKNGKIILKQPEPNKYFRQLDLLNIINKIRFYIEYKAKKKIYKNHKDKDIVYDVKYIDQEKYFYNIKYKYSAEDLAAGVQQFSEEILTEWISYWVKKTGMKKIALAGGVFANVKINQRILENCGVNDLFIYPNMGDGGLATGSAYLKYYQDNKYKPETSKTDTMYLGSEYSDIDILKCLKADKKIKYTKSKDIATDVAKLIAGRKIVGWFQGKMEFGPRALGGRSVVAMPDDPTINDWLNKRMQRTEFMPFAPSVLAEHMNDVFIIPKGCKRPAEYMTITYDVKPKWQGKIGAVNHIDNTARPQMVTKQGNPLYHKMISQVYKLTGLPMTINTSFNVHEEPIVMTPNDGLNALHRGMVDILAIGSYLVEIKK